MIPLDVRQLAEAVAGELVGVDAAVVVDAVAIDSRQAAHGSLFVAIAGNRVDGHDFAEAAVDSGAVAVLAARPLTGSRGQDLPCIVVDDPVLALGRLAAWVRRELLTCAVVGITGSSGKTSTKDLVSTVLASVGPTVAPEGSLNTEVGMPLTILSATPDTQFLVLEMGMRGPGHIAYLAELARPDVGVVINVGSAHLGMLGSREAIGRAKGELVEALSPSGCAVLNADDPIVRSMTARTSASVMTFGEGADSDVRAVDVVLDAGARPSFTVVQRSTGQTHDVTLRFSGEHYLSNALAAITVGLRLGAGLAQACEAVSAAEPRSRWRMEVRESPSGVTVVNDAYNANPESMRAALKTLAAMGAGRRTWAVLGEMLELGDESVTEHDAIGRLAVRLDISRLVCVGPGTRVMHLGASSEGSWGEESVHVEDVDAAIALVTGEVQPGDVVLVKASRSIGLERVAQALLGDAPGSEPAP